MLAPDGRSKAFSASANGYGRGEGCGAVVLKRLEDARADGDRVFAVIKVYIAYLDVIKVQLYILYLFLGRNMRIQFLADVFFFFFVIFRWTKNARALIATGWLFAVVLEMGTTVARCWKTRHYDALLLLAGSDSGEG